MKINKYNEFKNVSGSTIRKLRIESKLSQQDLAEKLQLLGIQLTSKEISKIEHDDRFPRLCFLLLQKYSKFQQIFLTTILT